MKNRKLIMGLMAITVFAGIGMISMRLHKQKDDFFKKEVSDERDKCVTVTHSSDTTDEGNEPENVETDATSDLEPENNLEDSGDCITVTQQNDESGTEVTQSEISRIEVNVVNMSKEVAAQIADYDAFLYAIKECFYKAGVMETEVVSLNRVTRDYNDNLVAMAMYVSSQTVNYFDVTYDLDTGSYYVLMD